MKKDTIEPINFLRVVGMFMVFMLHTALFSSQRGFWFNQHTWFLQTPAWGAVWIFFILSGYLIGKGFFEGRYQYNLKGIIKFYWTRFFKIALPTLGFVGLCCVLVAPQNFIRDNPLFLKKILTFTYDANPGFDGASATWYVSTLMQLYFLAPIICWGLTFVIEKVINEKQRMITVAILLIIIVCGLGGRHFLLYIKADWNSQVYVPGYMNLDLFISGILLNYFLPKRKKPLSSQTKLLKKAATMFLIIFIIFNSYIYYTGYITFYQYTLPSVYIIFTCIYIYIHESIEKRVIYQNIIVKIWINIINELSSISFGFYLFHSLILSRIYLAIQGSSPVVIHIKLLIAAFIITIPFAKCFMILSRHCSIWGNTLFINLTKIVKHKS